MPFEHQELLELENKISFLRHSKHPPKTEDALVVMILGVYQTIYEARSQPDISDVMNNHLGNILNNEMDRIANDTIKDLDILRIIYTNTHNGTSVQYLERVKNMRIQFMRHEDFQSGAILLSEKEKTFHNREPHSSECCNIL